MGHLIHFANNIVSLFLAPGMMLALGIAVWGVAYTRSESLACYARARRIVGATFVIYGLALLAEHFVKSNIVADFATRLVIMAISMSQAYLFTLTLVTLIDVEFLSARRCVPRQCYLCLPPWQPSRQEPCALWAGIPLSSWPIRWPTPCSCCTTYTSSDAIMPTMSSVWTTISRMRSSIGCTGCATPSAGHWVSVWLH